LHPAYVHVPPLHPALRLCAVSHAIPHPVQLVVVSMGVSQPLLFGAAASQSP
jgi:hypothetical protein